MIHNFFFAINWHLLFWQAFLIFNLLLCHRVSDSDDLSMSESEVGKLAVGIEKEMFNLCMNTDNKYKNKYRSLMFNLKDPKNKVSHFFMWKRQLLSI